MRGRETQNYGTFPRLKTCVNILCLSEGQFSLLEKQQVDLTTHLSVFVKMQGGKKEKTKQSEEVMNTLTRDDVGWRSQGLEAIKSSH